MKCEIERMEINYAFYFFACFRKEKLLCFFTKKYNISQNGQWKNPVCNRIWAV